MNQSWRRCVEEFEEARREIGVLGALAYVTMTLTCVKCHKHVREKRRANAE